MTFTQVPQDYILREWPRVHPMLKKATDITNGRADVWEIFDALISGEAQLWIVFDDKTPIAAITTKVKQYNGFKALFIDFVGGSKMNEWLKDVLVILKRFAKDNECDQLEGYGRIGWKKVLSKFGWKPEFYSYKMELDDGK